MRVYTHRAQTVLTADQYAALKRLAEEQKKPISLLIREAIEQVYFQKAAL